MEQYNEIKEILQESTCAHMADCLEMIPVDNLDALMQLIEQHRSNNTQRSIYRYQVVQDVTSLLEGHIQNPLFSQTFLHKSSAAHVDAPESTCDHCGAGNKALHMVSIPESDANKLCNDCINELPGIGMIDYRENECIK